MRNPVPPFGPRRARGTLLHERASKGVSPARPNLYGQVGGELGGARVVEATQPLAYFFDDTPEEGSAVERELPRVVPPDGAPVFFEGEAPDALKVSFASSIGGRRVLPEPVMRKLGFFVQKRPAGAVRKTGLPLPDGTECVARIAPFFDYGGPGAPAGPEILWHVPIDEYGRVHPATVRAGVGVGALVAHPPGLANARGWAEAIAKDRGIFLQAALWCLFCLSLAGPERDPLSSLERCLFVRPEGDVAAEVLRIGRLKAVLDETGRARELGLGHALAACRTRLVGDGGGDPGDE